MTNKEVEILKGLLWKACEEYGGELADEINEYDHNILSKAWLVVNDVLEERERQKLVSLQNSNI